MRDKLEAIQASIVTLKVDAIVNAANTTLLGGGGVDGAIHRAAGTELLAECRTLGGCRTGDAKITRGYKLPAKYVIHTVGPVWNGGGRGEPELLASCYRASLKLAHEHQVKTVAFPAISCGVFGYPLEQAVIIAVRTSAEFLTQHAQIEKILFACFDRNTLDAYRAELQRLMP
jgi:O-acetyl-ADP-ribose deacetylase